MSEKEQTKGRGVAAYIDEARLWARHLEMAKIGGTPAGGVHRLPFSPADTQSRRLLLTWAAHRGFSVEMDELANIFVRRPGSDGTALPVVSGSHSDTQPHAGRFDGIYGVLAAFEALEAIEDAGIRTKRPIEAVIWTAEEADARFGVGCLGSQAYASPSSLSRILELKDTESITVRRALTQMLSGHPRLKSRPLKAPIAYYVEAHIEQGPELEANEKTIGIVTAIHGQRGFKIEVSGEAGHAGNTPERLRKDALLAAERIITELRKVFHDPNDIVRFTIGRMDIVPNAMSVIPGHVMFTIDFRHPDEHALKRLGDQVEVVAQAYAGRCAVKATEVRQETPVPFQGIVPDTILAVTERLGYPYIHIPSGAGHDARYIAKIAPSGMIFIPCWRGISHNEAESATSHDLAAGSRVLVDTLVELANH
jgi:N-carbamoyl-L-amino-acid hydrolase